MEIEAHCGVELDAVCSTVVKNLRCKRKSVDAILDPLDRHGARCVEYLRRAVSAVRWVIRGAHLGTQRRRLDI